MVHSRDDILFVLGISVESISRLGRYMYRRWRSSTFSSVFDASSPACWLLLPVVVWHFTADGMNQNIMHTFYPSRFKLNNFYQNIIEALLDISGF